MATAHRTGPEAASATPYVPPIEPEELARRNREAIALLDAWEAEGDEEEDRATMAVGLASSLTLFLAGALVAGAAAGIFSSPQQAAVADIIGSKARGGTAVATYQMMADAGAIVGSVAVGEIAQHASFGAAFVISGGILLVGAVGWVLAPETRQRPGEHTPARALGPEVGGELP